MGEYGVHRTYKDYPAKIQNCRQALALNPTIPPSLADKTRSDQSFSTPGPSFRTGKRERKRVPRNGNQLKVVVAILAHHLLCALSILWSLVLCLITSEENREDTHLLKHEYVMARTAHRGA